VAFRLGKGKSLTFFYSVECSDPARNPYFPADFLSAHLQCSQPLWNCAKIKVVYRRARGERRLDIAQTIGLNCSMTHSPGKIEYNCRYFIMTFRTQIHNKKFGKNGFHTLQGTMSHRPLTNTSSFKITAAYSIYDKTKIPRGVSWLRSLNLKCLKILQKFTMENKITPPSSSSSCYFE
jgi:hypothetical protein